MEGQRPRGQPRDLGQELHDAETAKDSERDRADDLGRKGGAGLTAKRKEPERLEMTDEEIKRSYLGAKNPKKQVGILADLNLTKKKAIIEVLRKEGIAV